MFFDRAAILREAHAEARRRCAPCHYARTGDRYDPEMTAWVPKAGYRAIFAGKLREAWRMARAVAANAAFEASLPPIAEDVRAKADALRAEAWFEPFTMAGNARHAATLAAASTMLETHR